MEIPQPPRLRNALFLFGLAFCWGPSYYLIAIALRQWPPCTIVSTRLLFAGLILYMMLKVQRKSIWQWRHLWHRFIIMGAIANAIPFVLITYSEKWISTSLAGVINGSPPIFTAMLAHFFIDTERLTWRKVIGIILGVSGLVTVFLPTLSDAQAYSGLGVIFVTVASLCYAVGMVFARKYLMELPTLIAPTAQILSAGLMTLPFAFLIEKPHLIPVPNPSTLAAVAGLALIGTVLAFVLYYALVKSAGPTYTSMGTLLSPFVAIFFGTFFLNEPLEWTTLVGCTMILLGLIVANHLIRKDDLVALFGKRK